MKEEVPLGYMLSCVAYMEVGGHMVAVAAAAATEGVLWYPIPVAQCIWREAADCPCPLGKNAVFIPMLELLAADVCPMGER